MTNPDSCRRRSPIRRAWPIALALIVLAGAHALPNLANALDGGTLRVNTYNGWKAFEIISSGENPTGDGFNYSMPGTFDGSGAWMVDANTLRVLVNHEETDAAISEVDLDFSAFKTAIDNVISTGSTGGGTFVLSARQAYSRWSDDGGITFTNTSSMANTNFGAFCSGQAYAPNTFGSDRGFVDEIYINGEEWAGSFRLFALDSVNRDLYQLSGTAGSAPGGTGGMPFDAFENAALIDTGETDYVALLLSPDGGTATMRIYIGEKGKGPSGAPANTFLARNGLAYGSWYYLNGSYPALGATNSGSISNSSAGTLSSDKLEDIDTNPNDPTQVALGDQTSGVFIFDFSLDFSGGSFNAAGSSFTLTMISNTSGGTNSLNAPDNLDWTAAATLGSTDWSNGIVFVNEDNSSGEIWRMAPDGSNKLRIGSTTVGAESTGIFDLSEMVGFIPGSVLISNNQGSPSSMTVLINPNAASSTPDPVISGTVLVGASPLSGVSLNADGGGGNATTDVNGDYALSVPPDWSGSVTPELIDYDFTPIRRAYTNVAADDAGEDYTATYNPDLTAPTPNPLGFLSAPTATSFSEITMTAQTASDPSAPVEYFFECVSHPGASSGWQTDSTYGATGLSELTTYAFQVRARDAAGNEGSASPSASATTEAMPPEVLALGSWLDGDITGYSHTAPTGSDRALIVFGHAEANAAPTDFSAISYGGQPLTQVVEQLQNQSSAYSASAEIWILDEAGIQAATGSTIVATTTGAAETRRISSAFFAGVDQLDPIGQTGTAGENANETQTLTVALSGGELDAGDMVIANNSVRNDQNGDTSWTWQNGFTQIGAYSPPGAPYLNYSDAAVLSDGTAEIASVVILNNGVGALAVAALNHAADNGVCGDGSLDVGEQCDDGNTNPGDCCSSSCQFESAITVCRTASGVCDRAEMCTGTSGTCPADAFQPSPTVCRPSAGACDSAETCSGVSSLCPADEFLSAETVCRPAAGICDDAEACTGASSTCPADGFLSSVKVCRPAAGTCDAEETCTGATSDCPADVLEPASTICRGSSGSCDIEEFCTGLNTGCPSDAVLDGVPCLDSDVCNGAERCVSGICEPATIPIDCDDHDTCTTDTCDTISGCAHTRIPECVVAVPSMPWTGQALLALFLILSSGFALSAGSVRNPAGSDRRPL